MAPRIFIFSIVLGAENLSYLKSIETNARTFLTLNILSIGTVVAFFWPEPSFLLFKWASTYCCRQTRGKAYCTGAKKNPRILHNCRLSSNRHDNGGCKGLVLTDDQQKHTHTVCFTDKEKKDKPFTIIRTQIHQWVQAKTKEQEFAEMAYGICYAIF